MEKNQVCKLLIFAALLLSSRADALTLESRAVIESMRTRIATVEAKEPVAAVVVEPEIVEYVPGHDLKEALNRLRSGIYKNPESQPCTVRPLPVKTEVAMADGLYVPGARLAESLEKIRSRREIFRMIKVIKAASAIHNMPVVPDNVPVTPQPQVQPSSESMPEVKSETATEAIPEVKPEAKLEVKSETKPETANENTSSDALLKAAELRLQRKLTHAEPDEKKDAAVTDGKENLRRPDEDDARLNEEIGKFEYKMPANYRIIVR